MKTALITGANRGLGLEFCRQLKEQGYNVIALCRNSNPELDELGIDVKTNVDVTDEVSLANIAKSLDDTGIDLMINNAGIMTKEDLPELNFDDIRRQFEVNSLGPLKTVSAFYNSLSEHAKVILITSRMGSITDNSSGSYYGYRMSKAALNIAGVSLAHQLKDHKIAVGILHPGFVRTDLTGGNGDIDAEGSVKNMMQRIDDLSLENSGAFLHANGEKLPW